MPPKDRWGSPYDPRNGGKIQRPQARQERDQRQHQTRGCGDPNCAQCNPETAGRGTSGMPFDPPPGRWGTLSDAINREVGSLRPPAGWNRAIERAMMDELTTMITGGGGARAETPKVPASFTKARDAVKRWLIQAPDQAFDDIVGNDEALGQLRDAIQAPVMHKALYDAYGLKMPRGVLLFGPPGCGKTMFARAAASEMRQLYGGEVEFICISGADLQSMYVGETEGRIKAIFTFAREYKALKGHPLLVFLDEAEVLLPDRTGRVRRVAPWEESQVATFLAEMDGMLESGAFVLLATNRPEVIDQAVLRDGRCDFKIAVKRPTREAVEVILRKALAGVISAEADVETLVFAALESLYDPHKVIVEAHALTVALKTDKLALSMQLTAENVDVGHHAQHFRLEHILSGAMAASIPTRALRHAFARDKADGVPRGVTAADVVRAVGDVFAENRGLDHSFALQEFMGEVAGAMDEPKAERPA